MTKMLDSEFEIQLYYDVHVWTNTLEQVMNPFIAPAMG